MMVSNGIFLNSLLVIYMYVLWIRLVSDDKDRHETNIIFSIFIYSAILCKKNYKFIRKLYFKF